MAQVPEISFPSINEKPALLSLGGIFVVIAAVVVVALSIITSLVAATKRSQAASLERKKLELENQLKSGDIAQAKAQLQGLLTSSATLKQVLDNRINWRLLFDELQKSLIKSASLVNLNFEERGVLRIDGEATDFSSIAKLVASFNRSSVVKDVAITAITPSGTAIKFSLTVELRLEKLTLGGGAKP